MQDEVNEKVIALSIKTSKLTAEVLQKAMKAVLAKGKQQLSKAPHGKITMRQLNADKSGKDRKHRNDQGNYRGKLHRRSTRGKQHKL